VEEATGLNGGKRLAHTTKKKEIIVGNKTKKGTSKVCVITVCPFENIPAVVSGRRMGWGRWIGTFFVDGRTP
jgi:hypothetical protein